jgi:hypothetical protein
VLVAIGGAVAGVSTFDPVKRRWESSARCKTATGSGNLKAFWIVHSMCMLYVIFRPLTSCHIVSVWFKCIKHISDLCFTLLSHVFLFEVWIWKPNAIL